MSDILYRNRFRVPSTRLPGWDYGRGDMYCVTICTQGRVCWLGEIAEGKMVLSQLGKIVAEEWLEMARRRPNVSLDAWTVMPNHLHGILCFETPRIHGHPMPLGEVIGHFKGACSRRIWAMGERDFAWQTRFFDQIVRARTSYSDSGSTSWRTRFAGRRIDIIPTHLPSDGSPPL